MEQLVSPAKILLTAFVLLAAGLVAGYPLARCFEASPRLRFSLAPALGLPIIGVLAAIAFLFVPLHAGWLAVLFIVVIALTWKLCVPLPHPAANTLAPSWACYLIALIIAVFCAMSIAPQYAQGGVGFGTEIFDHTKLAMIDAIRREGLPLRNPFYRQAGSDNLMYYYYLYYLIAALGAVVTNATGWEADIALTGVGALLSLVVMTWLAIRMSGRREAAWWVLAICMTYGCKPILRFIFGPVVETPFVQNAPYFFSWLNQARWTPQHLFSATTCLLVFVLLDFLAGQKRIAWRVALVAGLLAAAVFGSSVYVGGAGLAAVGICFLLGRAWEAIRESRSLPFCANLALTGVVATLAALPWLKLCFDLLALRPDPSLGFWLWPVVSVVADRHDVVAILKNIFAYWTLRPILDYGFVFLMAMYGIFLLRNDRREPACLSKPLILSAIFVPMVIAETIRSVIANDDLGWRIILIPLCVMTVFSAAKAADIMATDDVRQRKPVIVLSGVFLIPALIVGLQTLWRDATDYSVYGPWSEQHRQFAAMKSVWHEVESLTGPMDAIADNPYHFGEVSILAPVNMDWAFFSNRRNCTSTVDELNAYAPQLDPQQKHDLIVLFRRVFDGIGSDDDLAQLKNRYLCDYVLVLPQDGLWGQGRDVLAKHADLVKSDNTWRLFRLKD